MYFILPARHKKLDQFSQQNTHCGTVILQNSSLGAPTFYIDIEKIIILNKMSRHLLYDLYNNADKIQKHIKEKIKNVPNQKYGVLIKPLVTN